VTSLSRLVRGTEVDWSASVAHHHHHHHLCSYHSHVTVITSHWRGRGDLYTQTKQQYLQLHTIHGDPETYRFDSLPMNDNNWAHSMGPQRSPLSRVVVVVVDIDAQAARDSTASDI